MAIGHAKMPRISVRIQSRSPSLRSESTFDFSGEGDYEKANANDNENGLKQSSSNNGNEVETDQSGNKIMVVVDSSIEARGALEWTLSHTVQRQDTLILLHVVKPSKSDNGGKRNLIAHELLHSMKSVCQTKRPGVRVVVEVQEGKEKGPVIVEAAKQQNVHLLVLGQRKQKVIWRWLKRLVVKRRKHGGVVEYCIQNAKCMTIAVRRKGRKAGGYLITTKRHKNFWLLA